ncbi:transposase [Dyadobacter jiangsuensis]
MKKRLDNQNAYDHVQITKKIINRHFVPHFSKGQRGPECSVGLWRTVRSIVHRIKTDTQWRQLPTRSWFGKFTINWNAMYYYYNKWCMDGSWQHT